MRAVDKINFKNRAAISYFLNALNKTQILTKNEMWKLKEELEDRWLRVHRKIGLKR